MLCYFIHEQHYIELMESGRSLEAIALLQKQLVPKSPFGKDKTNLFKLASMIMKPLQICKPTERKVDMVQRVSDPQKIATMR